MAANANAMEQAGSRELLILAERQDAAPLADTTPQLYAERCCRELRDHAWPFALRARQSLRMELRQRSPSSGAGWCSPPNDSSRTRHCKITDQQRARCRSREVSTESMPKRRRAAPVRRVPDCQHVAVKVFPPGPRDNGEVYWKCSLCGADL